jgi:CubicO group peptidase (beta-lactamase class C family)
MRQSVRAFVFLFAILSIASFASAAEPVLEGHWEGAIEVPGQSLEVSIDLVREGDGYTGTIDIPAQGAQNLPLKAISLDGAKAQFQISGVPGDPTFTGDISEDGLRMEGIFAQGGGMMPFKLTSGVDPVEAAREALADLEPIVMAGLEDWHAAGVSVAVVVDGKIVLAEGYGFRDLEKELPATADTLYGIGSSTKAFTTFVLGQLVNEGKMEWDQPVVELLPDFKMYDNRTTEELTPRDMVTHRSGLPRHDMIWYSAPETTREEFVSRLRHLEPNKPLRETWQYNNLMFLTAGYLAEQLTDMSWEENVRTRIFEPLGMDRSNFDVSVSENDADHATPYITSEDDKPQQVDFRQLTAAGPAGSINSSVNDMSQWLRLFLGRGTVEDNTLLPGPAMRELVTPQMVMGGLPNDAFQGPSSYAHGWMVTTWHGHLRVEHGGNIDGFSALVTLFPHDDVGIVVLANQNGSAMPGLLTATISNRILELEPHDYFKEAATNRDAGEAIGEQAEKDKDRFRVKGTKPSHDLDDFVGEFGHPGYGTIEVIRDGKSLAMQYGTIRMPLEHWNYDVFNVVDTNDSDSEIIPEDLRINFQGDTRGRVRWLHAPFEPFVEPIRFVRQPSKRMYDTDFLTKLTGAYDLGPQRVRIRLVGDHLALVTPGGAQLDLEPTDELEFDFKGMTGFSVKFSLDEDPDTAGEMTVIQPNAVITGKRAEEDEEEDGNDE